VTAGDAGGIAKLPKPDRRMLEIAEKIIEQQEGTFDPSTFKDRYEDAVRDLIAHKKKRTASLGGIVSLPPERSPRAR